MSRWYRVAACAAALALVGCGVGTRVGPAYVPPPLATGVAAPPLVSATAPAYAADTVRSAWWRLYEDATLDTLVGQAFAANADLRVAAATLERALAVLREAGGARQPSLDASGSVARTRSSGAAQGKDAALPTVTAFDVGLSASYQVDLFGRVSRTLEAARADVGAVRGAVDVVRITVAAETARAYADACVAGYQLDVATRTVRLQEESLRLTERLRAAGRLGALDVTRSRALLAQARTALPPLEAQRRAALFRLAVLTGRPPAEAPVQVLACHTPPRLASVIPVGDGAGLLRRRPDVRAAERRLAAATARIGVATADLYPSVSLGASVGTSALDAGELGTSPSFRFSLGPLIRFSIPNTGVARARIAQAEASTKGALADFDRTVLGALRDTETALAAYAHELDRNAELRTARDESAEALRIARRLQAAGAAGSLDVLDAERSLASAEAALAASDGLLSTEQIAIFLALGGGWEVPAGR
ncbi:MAG TPA: efflux transporter outer membrane subunit [Gemmatimonadales bacterium]|nr:efflux transporter outer membrane subunit [Gemmatimonadales bacterium]